jgi:hypothetical protein
MTKESDYRTNAAATMRLAHRASSIADKGRLLKLAEAWLDLADRARTIARRLHKPGNLHPLLQEKLEEKLDRRLG